MPADLSGASSGIDNLATYEKADVVEHYAKQSDLQGCEAYVFEKYVPNGSRIFDVGVGGGRTTPYLLGKAKEYIGADYAPSMVEICKKKFPDETFVTCDASDLSSFENDRFDVIIFSFNGIDTLSPDSLRIQCLKEFYRTLAPGGRLIFSTHNAKALLTWPNYEGGNLKQKLWRTIYASYRSVWLSARMLMTRAYWRGEGYVAEPTHGGLHNHCAVPPFVINETSAQGFRLMDVVNGRFPLKLPPFATPWYYYVFEKPSSMSL